MIMKNIIYLLLLLVLFNIACTEEMPIRNDEVISIDSRSVSNFIQEPLRCGNEDSVFTRGIMDPPITVKSLASLSKTIYIYKVYIHIIRGSSNNNGIENNEKDGICETLMDRLNAGYYKRSIYFTLVGSEFIDSDYYNSLNQNSADNIFGVNEISNAINVYLFTNISNNNFNDIGGKVNGIPGTSFWVSLNSYHGKTPVHEMGHILGLYHTHRGTSDNTNPEYVDGTESNRRGDYIVDTPADPGLSDAYGYYTGTSQDVDAHGDVYAPDTTNFMSYYCCRTSFTNWQEAWMRTYIEDENLNVQYRYNGENLIVGPRIIGTTSTYSLNTNILSEYYLLDNWNGTSIKWTVRKEGYTGSSKKLDVTNTYTTEAITLTAGSEYDSYKYSIQATITDYRGYTLTTPVKYAYKISASSGSLQWSSESRSGNYLGYINLASPSSSSPIKVHQGGILTFIYTHSCGASSYIDTDIFNFNIYSPSGFTKEAGSNHAFNCEQYLSTTTNGTMMLSFTYPGSSTIMQIPLQVMQGSYAPLKTDSLDIEVEVINEKERLTIE